MEVRGILATKFNKIGKGTFIRPRREGECVVEGRGVGHSYWTRAVWRGGVGYR